MKMPLTGWPIFVLFLAVFLTAYAPVVLTSYAFFDDYENLLKGPQAGEIARIAEGRPLNALCRQIFLHGAMDIEDLRTLRFVGIVGLAVLAWSVFRLLVRTGWGQVQSFCVGVILCTTLPFQVYTAWAIAAFNVFAALASGLAFTLAERAFDEKKCLPKALLGAGASLALLAALTIHQSAAMFFWVFAAVMLLKPDTPLRTMLRRFGWYGLIASVGMLLGFGVYQLGLALNPGVAARTGLVHDLPLKAVWFLLEALPNALNFALLSPAYWFFSDGSATLSPFHRGVDILIAWSVLGTIVGGLMLYVRGTRQERLGQLGIVLLLLPLSYAPSLLIAESGATYRTLSGLASVVVVAAFFALHGYLRPLRRFCPPFRAGWANAVMGGGALASVLSAAYHVQTYLVAPQVRELEIMRSQLSAGDLAQARGIYVIRPAWQDTLAPLARYDEFGRPSSAMRPWTAGFMVALLLRDMAPAQAHLPITAVSADEPIAPPPDSLVVDMRNLRLQAQRDDSGP